MASAYLNNLLTESPEVVERYLQKIQVIGGLDPFAFQDKDLDFSIESVPPVTNMDIVSYLVLTHSFYSREQMKAFKSLQSYKFFEAGFVIKVGTKIINDFYVLVGKVKHSQKANLQPLNVWCIISKDGSICTAHCTCMAGLSEVCSHVGAILFSAEYATRSKEAMSCTDVKAAWPMPSTTSVPIVPVKEMDFGKSPLQQETEIPAMTNLETEHMLKRINSHGSNAVLMRIVEPFASQIADNANKTLPLVLNIFSENNLDKDHLELITLAKNVDISLKPDEITSIEEGTRNQNENPDWYQQRAGRITASKFKAVCRTNKKNPSLSLIKSICYPTKILFSTKATSWGILQEQTAVVEYTKEMEDENHENLHINHVGFVISQEWPQIGASPDRLIYCDCHLGGCLEIKCPYLLHVNDIQNIEDYLKMKNTCLVKNNDRITLDKNHLYYYQVQMQIFVTQTLYCDFVIWSPKIFFKTRIFPDKDFFNRNCKIALQFHSEVIMPELLGRYFTRTTGTAQVIYWCICKDVDDGRPMIKCDRDECEIQWFHFECVNLEDTPNEPWFCHKCEIDRLL